MKKIISILLAAVMALSLAACGGNKNSGSSSSNETATKAAETKAESNTVSKAANTGSKVLVLYFSAANTKDVDAVTTATPMVNGTSSVKWIADIIHDEVGGDIAPIVPSKDYPLEYNALADAAKAEVDNNERPAFEALEVNPADYDTIFIGYPIWWYTIPMVLETFFDKYDLSGKTIVPFNTHAGSRDGGTYKTIQEREPNAKVLEGLAIAGSDAGSDSAKASVTEWIKGLNLE